jgi:hypothetical protein
MPDKMADFTCFIFYTLLKKFALIKTLLCGIIPLQYATPYPIWNCTSETVFYYHIHRIFEIFFGNIQVYAIRGGKG